MLEQQQVWSHMVRHGPLLRGDITQCIFTVTFFAPVYFVRVRMTSPGLNLRGRGPPSNTYTACSFVLTVGELFARRRRMVS